MIKEKIFKAGFTLLEVLLGISLSVIIMLGIYTYMNYLELSLQQEIFKGQKYLSSFKSGFVILPVILSISVLLLITASAIITLNSVISVDEYAQGIKMAESAAISCIKQADLLHDEYISSVEEIKNISLKIGEGIGTWACVTVNVREINSGIAITFVGKYRNYSYSTSTILVK